VSEILLIPVVYSVGKQFGAKAVQTAVDIIDRCPKPSLNRGVVSLVGERIAASVSQRVRVRSA
jgi:hypothetical protein